MFYFQKYIICIVFANLLFKYVLCISIKLFLTLSIVQQRQLHLQISIGSHLLFFYLVVLLTNLRTSYIYQTIEITEYHSATL